LAPYGGPAATAALKKIYPDMAGKTSRGVSNSTVNEVPADFLPKNITLLAKAMNLDKKTKFLLKKRYFCTRYLTIL
jgi:hypothetical protein